MVIRGNIQIGERTLLCAIIEMAVQDFITMVDDPVARQTETFKSAENFLFGGGAINRTLLRDPKTGNILEGKTDNIVGCTLKDIVQALNVNGEPLNISYLRDGIKRKLEAQRRANAHKTELYRWKG